MAMLVIAAVEAAIDIGLVIYAVVNQPREPLPALRDLQVMTGTNGAPIPYGWGTARVAGNVLWTPGIQYYKLGKKSSAGEALGPKSGYVFYASLAVAFGEGPGIINRVWADSKLIYDANPSQANAVPVTEWPAWSSTQLYNPGNQVNYAGNVWQALRISTDSVPSLTNSDWDIISTYPPYSTSQEYFAGDIVSLNGQLYVCQVANNNGTVGAIYPNSGATASEGSEDVLYWINLQTLYPAPTIYPGDNNQLPDSLIQAAEGATYTPAYRGLIYVVWENFVLSNFADRIPSFRAEVTYTKVA